jgi:hypothetical protein
MASVERVPAGSPTACGEILEPLCDGHQRLPFCSVPINVKLRSLAYRSNHPISLVLSIFEEETTETAFAPVAVFVSGAYQGRELPGSLRLRYSASAHGFARVDSVFLI